MYSALQSGSEATPSSLEVLVHREKRQDDDLNEKEKARHVKAKKRDKERPKEHLKERPKAAGAKHAALDPGYCLAGC